MESFTFILSLFFFTRLQHHSNCPPLRSLIRKFKLHTAKIIDYLYGLRRPGCIFLKSFLYNISARNLAYRLKFPKSYTNPDSSNKRYIAQVILPDNQVPDPFNAADNASGLKNRMYPNPFANEITVDFNNIAGTRRAGAFVYDMTGRFVCLREGSSSRIK